MHSGSLDQNQREKLCRVVQAILDLRNSMFPFLNRVMFDLRNISVLNLKLYVNLQVEIFLKLRVHCITANAII